MSALETYRRKRDFRRTPEPRGQKASASERRSFVIQKHAATRLHYDFRLELDGVLKSWAVPKGPSLDPAEKRLAVHVEDHPLEYGSFEGVIPKGEYGGGAVLLWDRGHWMPDDDPREGYRKGTLVFELAGEKLKGAWSLVRMRGDDSARENWLLIKRPDAAARPAAKGDILKERPESVTTGRSLEEIATDSDRIWHSKAAPEKAGKNPRGGRNRQARRISSSPGDLPGAVRAKMPDWIPPQLATRVEAAPAGSEWLHEIKYDGYRALCRITKKRARFLTRKGLDWTHRFGALADVAARLPVKGALVDGEVAALRSDGRSSFQALQEGLGSGGEGLVYFAFDLLHLDGYDLTGVPLAQRKSALASLLEGGAAGPALRYSDHVTGRGPAFFQEACEHHLEGIVSKRADRPYRPDRSKDWVKVKCGQRQDFVIGGYTEPSGSRVALGALLLGGHDSDGALRYVGRVGTGFTEEMLRDLRARLGPLGRRDSPFGGPLPRAETKGARWVEPELVAEVTFTEWTRDGRLRHPSFQGLREDIPVGEVGLEAPEPTPASSRAAKPTKGGRANRNNNGLVAGVRLTHPDRVLFPAQGITKRDLALFYHDIADWILPHLKDRPLMLVRCPQGEGKECFYQKRADDSLPDSVRRVKVEEVKGETIEHVAISSLTGIVALVQLGVLEFHTWGARADDIERPDRLVFDLDPDPALPWREVIDAARDLRERLEGLELATYPKTTGGKGLHIEVPLVRDHGWEAARSFSWAVVQGLAREHPRRYVTTASKAKRRGKIFLDYLRNARGATAIAPYSTRARPRAPVATPLRWDELSVRLSPDRYDIGNLRRRLSALAEDPWAGYEKARSSLTPAIEAMIARGPTAVAR